MLIKGCYPKTNKARRARKNEEFFDVILSEAIKGAVLDLLAKVEERRTQILAGYAHFISDEHPL